MYKLAVQHFDGELRWTYIGYCTATYLDIGGKCSAEKTSAGFRYKKLKITKGKERERERESEIEKDIERDRGRLRQKSFQMRYKSNTYKSFNFRDK